MARAVQVVIDCADPDRLAGFWAGVLGYELDAPPPGFASWPDALQAWGVPESEWNSRSAVVDPDGVGPRIFFQRVSEQKGTMNRLHLDVRSAPRGRATPEMVDAERDRIVALGATVARSVAEAPDYFHVMLDPEGNEFCVT